MEEDPENEDEYPLIDDYDDLHQKIVDYLTSGKVHSTLVGLIINLDGDKGEKDVIEATVFADYIINFLKKVN
jgi:hypothetical protein